MKSILGLVHIALSIWAILHILKSNAETPHKALWTLFVLFFPLIGLGVWYFAGPKTQGKLI